MRNLLMTMAVLLGPAVDDEQIGSARAGQSGWMREHAPYSAAGAAPAAQTDSASDEEFRLPVDDRLAAEIDSMIAGLGSPEYQTREAATARLIKIGLQAFPKLRAVYHESDQLEVRSRIETIVRTAYFNHHLFDRNAFLGISQNPSPPTHENDPRIPDGHFGIKVRETIENTAAKEVGLKAGDVIIALDGEPLAPSDLPATTAFGETIRLRGPGTKITLTILRGKNEFDVEVILGRRPRKYYNNQGTVTQMFTQCRRNFGIWWVKHFRQPRRPPQAAPPTHPDS